MTTTCEAKLEKVEARFSSFALGQMVYVGGGQTTARVVDVASNGVWILRAATNAEYLRKGKGQIRERVKLASLRAV